MATILVAPSALLVLDTNVLLDDLTLIQSIHAWHSKFKHTIAIPSTVIDERTPSLSPYQVL
jgi:predicted ribonuclease YlaK